MAAAALRGRPPPLQLKRYNLDGEAISDGLGSKKDRLTPLLMSTLGHSPYKGLPEKKLTPSPVQRSWVRA